MSATKFPLVDRYELLDCKIFYDKEILEKNDIYSIGRYGSWTYCSIEDNILEARELAEKFNK